MVIIMMPKTMIILHVHKAIQVNQVIYVYKAFSHTFSSKRPCEVGRAGITGFVLTDVKSGSDMLRDVPGATQLERNGAYIQSLSLERAWHETGSEHLWLGSQLALALSSIGRDQGWGRPGSKRVVRKCDCCQQNCNHSHTDRMA